MKKVVSIVVLSSLILWGGILNTAPANASESLTKTSAMKSDIILEVTYPNGGGWANDWLDPSPVKAKKKTDTNQIDIKAPSLEVSALLVEYTLVVKGKQSGQIYYHKTESSIDNPSVNIAITDAINSNEEQLELELSVVGIDNPAASNYGYALIALSN